jgi:integrase
MSWPKLINVARNIYRVVGTKVFLHSVRLPGKAYPTKRKLAATTKTAARAEVETLNTRRREAALGVGLDPYVAALTIAQLAAKWIAAHCPDRQGRARTGAIFQDEKDRLNRTLKWWGARKVLETHRKHCIEYAAARQAQSKTLRLTRSVDRELQTLSNLFEWAIDVDLIKYNPIAKRKRFDNPKLVRHCTAFMPESDEDFHRLAAWLLDSETSRALGWQLLLEGLTGARTSEILACRTDAARPEQAGYLDHEYMGIQRLKDGIDPWVALEAAPGHSPLRDCLQAFLNWHEQRYAHSPWFIPGRNPEFPMERRALTHALKRACAELKIKPVTSHGLRAYHVAGLRSMGRHDEEIAARLGHKSTHQVEHHYGKVREKWRGNWKMDFLPDDFAPAWASWLPKRPYQKLIVPDAKERTGTKLAAPPEPQNTHQNQSKRNLTNDNETNRSTP